MSADLLAQAVVSGLLLGGIFALVAVGLSLIFGIMDVVNFAHGELLMLAMYTTFWAYALFRLDPLVSLPLNAVLFFSLGAVLYELVIRRVLSARLLAQMLATFGLGIIIRSAVQFWWTPNPRAVTDPIVQGSVRLLGLFFERAHVVSSMGAFLAFGGVYWFITRTELGLALRATAQDRQVAALMGVNSERMYQLAWGIGIGCLGIAGALLANYFAMTPTVGDQFALTSYVVVALGGFGSIPGALLGAVIVGLVQGVGGLLLPSELKLAVIYCLYLVVVWFRPRGLLGKF